MERNHHPFRSFSEQGELTLTLSLTLTRTLQNIEKVKAEKSPEVDEDTVTIVMNMEDEIKQVLGWSGSVSSRCTA